MTVTRIISHEVCDDLIRVRADKPEGYSFRAGQWFRISIPDKSDAGTRTFSIACAPADPWLEMATRRSDSAFKRALIGMREGDPVEVSPPGGRLRLPEPVSSAVFLIGGIGITPVRSLLRDAIANGLGLAGAVLFYGNGDERCVPYADELPGWSANGLGVVEVLERPPAGWSGERGFITADVLRRAGVTEGRNYLVTGPPPMVSAMTRMLDELGIDESSRRVEAFTGGSYEANRS